jgi:hypothetical protein
MLNRGGDLRNFAEAGKLPILARGRSIKNSVSGENKLSSVRFLFDHPLLIVLVTGKVPFTINKAELSFWYNSTISII